MALGQTAGCPRVNRAKKFMCSPRNRKYGLLPLVNRRVVLGLSRLLSGPLNRLNAILSLLHPLDRYRSHPAIGSAIGRPLSRPISHPNTGGSPQPPRSKPLGGAQPRASGAIVSKTPLKQARNKIAIEGAILNRVLDRDWTLNRRGPLSPTFLKVCVQTLVGGVLSVPIWRDWRYYFVRRPPKRDRLQRRAFPAIPPLQSLTLDCDRPFLWKEVGV